MSLTAQEMTTAVGRIAEWRADPEVAVACPRCGCAGLAVTDHSARPCAEWYHLGCTGCGLDETIHIPLSPPAMGGLD